MRLTAVVERGYHLPLEEMNSWTRTIGVVLGRRVFSLMAKEYGCTGGEIAGFLEKGPTALTEYFRQLLGEPLMSLFLERSKEENVGSETIFSARVADETQTGKTSYLGRSIRNPGPFGQGVGPNQTNDLI